MNRSLSPARVPRQTAAHARAVGLRQELDLLKAGVPFASRNDLARGRDGVLAKAVAEEVAVLDGRPARVAFEHAPSEPVVVPAQAHAHVGQHAGQPPGGSTGGALGGASTAGCQINTRARRRMRRHVGACVYVIT